MDMFRCGQAAVLLVTAVALRPFRQACLAAARQPPCSASLCVFALASHREQAIAICGHLQVQAGAVVSVSVQTAGPCALLGELAALCPLQSAACTEGSAPSPSVLLP